MTRSGLVLSAVLLLCSVLTAAPAQALDGHGGSNYAFYRIDHDPGGCDREPYGVVNSYDKAPATIGAQLRQMYAAGQRRLRIPLFHQHGPDSGTVLNSTGGRLSAQNRKNLADLLAAVKATGYQEIELGFFPIGAADPHDWTQWNESQYQENRSIVEDVRSVVRAAGLPYQLDLLNEGMPMSGQTTLRDYAKRLWHDYTAAHGKADTVGFSMTVWIADRARQIPDVYGGDVPHVFDVHLYGDDNGNGDEYQQFVDAHNELASKGYHQGWIIGEAYYDDATAADGIARAIRDTGQVVFYLTQWQLSRSDGCADKTVDVAPPVSYAHYLADGF
ncbi:hypothetical protein PV458_24855 [Streptomyces sp. MN03-5084-2B]|nr:hypothetical protein [Streptomyces sp. MN03-5084-2B]